MEWGSGDTRANGGEAREVTRSPLRGRFEEFSKWPHVRDVGNIAVKSVSDGFLLVELDKIHDIALPEAQRVLGLSGSCHASIALNVFLLFLEDGLALVDAGGGPVMGPIVGNLMTNLARLGVARDDIRYVLLTHLHPDHVRGLIGQEGSAAFPNAEVFLHDREAAYWLEGGIDPRLHPRMRKNLIDARHSVAPYRDRLRRVTEGKVLSGVSAVELPGHTPGHTGWMIESAGSRLLLWGDIVHFGTLQMYHPDTSLSYDADRDAARITRRRTLDMVAREGLEIGGAHLAFPGFGRVVHDGPGYRYVPSGVPDA